MNIQKFFTIIAEIKTRTNPTKLFAALTAFMLVPIILSSVFPTKVSADTTYFPLSPTTPFQQNWSDASLITVNNDWSGVPSIVGYSGQINGTLLGVDPQTVLDDHADQPYIFANITNPNTATNGSGGTGFAELEITNPVVAFRGSTLRDAPNMDIRLDTTACPTANDIRVSYNLRDVDGGGNNSDSQVALHYRVGGGTGDYTNIPAGYVADATTGPNLATLVTNVNVALPADAKNQPELHVRIMTTKSTSVDEYIGIDDIFITCAAPSAAAVTVGGRAVSANGRGLSGVIVTLSGDLAAPLQARTNPFGFYRFDNVPSGATYILSTSSKRYTFINPTLVINVFEDVGDADFMAAAMQINKK